MIQILGLRPKQTGKLGEKHFTTAPSVQELFKNIDTYVDKIPESERWNVFYSVAKCQGKHGRDFKESSIIAFDVDGIDLTKIEDYHDPILKALNVVYDKTGIVYSGNGLHYIIDTSETWTDPDHFGRHQEEYKQVLFKVTKKLKAAGLPGKLDMIFDRARILRLPNTKNIKPDRPERLASIIQGSILPQNFLLADIAGVITIDKKDCYSANMLKSYPPDTEAVQAGCSFLKFCKEKQTEVDENQWYGMLGIIGRLDDGHKLAHEYSKDDPRYTPEETDFKLGHALNSGPLYCKTIQAKGYWDKCHDCAHFNKNEKFTPYIIKGEGYIASEKTGFHNISKKTGEKTSPNYEDLTKFYDKRHSHVVMASSGMSFVYNGKHYSEQSDAEIEAFAQDHFDPYAKTNMTKEFKNLVKRTNLRRQEWFTDSIERKINLQNGVFNIDTHVLSSHSTDYGFRSILNFDYDEKATCPMFNQFMEDITSGDKEREAVLLEYAAYAISNDTCKDKVLLLSGEGANGKTKFLNILKKLAGDGYVKLGAKDFTNTFRMQLLDGALLCITEELPAYRDRDFWEKIKDLASGGELTVEKKRKDPYRFSNRAKFIFTCNALPQGTDSSYGFHRKLIIAPFTNTFSKERGNKVVDIDIKITDTEMPGIFNRILEAYARLRKNDYEFTTSAVVKQAGEDYQEDIDTVLAWRNEYVIVTGNLDDYISFKDAYAHFVNYMEEAGMRQNTPNRIHFTRTLKKHLNLNKDAYMKKKGQRVVTRVRLVIPIGEIV